MNKERIREISALITQTDRFVHKSSTMFGDKFDYQDTVYSTQDDELIIGCLHHGNVSITPKRHFRSRYGCAKCDIDLPREYKRIKVLEQATLVHGDRYDYSRLVYVNMDEKVEIICSKHGSFWQDLYSHTARATDCPTCSREADRLSKDDFVSKARVIHGDLYDYGKVVYDVNSSIVVITCKKHGDFNQRAGSHLAGNKCTRCARDEFRLTTDEFIRNAREVHGDTYDYSRVVYTGNKNKVEIICKTHGSFFQKPNGHISSRQGCRFCSESRGEVAVESYLKEHGLKYIREYRIKPALYRYDFYLPELKVLIEFHGQQHYKPVEIFGGEIAYQSQIKRDAAKKKLARSNDLTLIVLSYLDLSDNSVKKALVRKLKKFLIHEQVPES